METKQAEEMMKHTKSKSLKVVLAVVVGGLAIAGGAYMLLQKKKAPAQTKVA